MIGIERQLIKLEAASAHTARMPVIFVSFQPGPDLPATAAVDGRVWHREPDELPDAFLDRVAAEARPARPGCAGCWRSWIDPGTALAQLRRRRDSCHGCSGKNRGADRTQPRAAAAGGRDVGLLSADFGRDGGNDPDGPRGAAPCAIPAAIVQTDAAPQWRVKRPLSHGELLWHSEPGLEIHCNP